MLPSRERFEPHHRVSSVRLVFSSRVLSSLRWCPARPPLEGMIEGAGFRVAAHFHQSAIDPDRAA